MKSRFKHVMHEYFNFSRKDRNGLIVLSTLVVLAAIANLIVDHLDRAFVSNFPQHGELSPKTTPEAEMSSGELFLFPFDPNTVTTEQLDSINLSRYIKSNILKYREAGGRFITPADVRRIYGMTDSIFMEIEPYLLFASGNSRGDKVAEMQLSRPDKSFQTKSSVSEYQSGGRDFRENVNILRQIELNSADSAQLVSLHGIGPVYAARILKYRNLLGGFYSKSQLLEVYGISEEAFNHFSEYVFSDTLKVERLRLNFSEYTDFVRHPYFKKEHVEAILNFRQMHGPFTSEKQLLSAGLVDSATFLQVRHYITYR